MANPSSIRFEPGVLDRLGGFVTSHPGLSLSSAANQLVDEALRMQRHPLVVFRDGPAGRRARLTGGPDVWEVIRAVRSAREAEPGLTAENVINVVVETSGVPAALVRAALDYWAEYPQEIDSLVERAQQEERRAEEQWWREREMLGE
jgi:hypothetical protein